MIETPALPPHALLQRYSDRGYTDCFACQLPRSLRFEQYVEAFYSTAVFRLERWILRWAVQRPSTDAELRELAAGGGEQFAAWDVEQRAQDQLLLCDLNQRTRSWLMLEPDPAGGSRLYFGSAVVGDRQSAGTARLPTTYRALLGFHRLYSRVLLDAARRRLLRRPQ